MTTSVSKFILTALIALAAFAALPITAHAAGGSGAWGASVSDADASKKINVVKKYKADPEGKKDSRHAIQAALNYAGENGSQNDRVMVYLPKGTYKISGSLKIYSNTDLLLDDDAKIVKCFDSGCMLRNESSGAGGYSGAENISIRGGTWDGNTSSYGGAYAFSNIRIGHAKNILIRNTSIINNKNGHHLECGGVSGMTIENCYFGGYSGSLLKEAIQLDIMNCYEVFAGYAPFDDTPCENVIIRNNTFKNLMRGIGSHTAVVGKYYTDITITGNTFNNVNDLCMMLYNYRRCSVTGNVITDCGAGITFNYISDENFKHFFSPVAGFDSAAANINHDADTVISGNDISTFLTSAQDWPFGIKIYGGYTKATSTMPEADYYVNNIDILNNVVRSSDAALKINDTNTCTVSGNTFTTIDGGNDVQLCNITYASSLDINDNTVKNSRKSGLNIDNCKTVTVEGNTMSGNSGVAVLCRNTTDSKVSRNNLSKNDVGGVKLDTGCGSMTVEKNVIKQEAGYGVKLTGCGSGTDIKVKGNDFSGGELGIICTKEGKALLQNNSFEAVADKVSADAEGLVTLTKAKRFAAEEITDDKIKLTWKAISEADGIGVFRRTAGGEYEHIASVESGSIFQDERLFSGTNYFYKLVPYIIINDNMSGNTESEEIEARTKVNIENAYIECVSEAGFTGRPVCPKFRIIANSNDLVEDVDYVCSYQNNIYTGTALISVTGRGDYIGTLNYNFEITIDAPAVNDAARRVNRAIFGKLPQRRYHVTCTSISSQLLADSDVKLNAAQRSIDALRLAVPVKTSSETAIWNGSGYNFY
ncbi:MAG: right-handed parallel beta-helix repeat-containing protein [Ruminococcus sp.]|nr:right-handed parallel beta-helix repeat-containing protein [Ruminococcus sp.]